MEDVSSVGFVECATAALRYILNPYANDDYSQEVLHDLWDLYIEQDVP